MVLVTKEGINFINVVEKQKKRNAKKMRKHKKTIQLARIRRLIREAINWYSIDKGMPNFWNSENYQYAQIRNGNKGNFPYYVRSSRAIIHIALKIYELVDSKKDDTNKT